MLLAIEMGVRQWSLISSDVRTPAREGKSIMSSPSMPSWKWLSRASSARELAASGKTSSSRPCLPVIEQLGDRVMLSAAPIPAAASTDDPPINQILIGLLQGELKLATSELSALKIASAVEDPSLVNKLNHRFLKIDEVIFNLGEAVIKGELTEQKETKAIAQIDLEFLKLDALIGGFSQDVQNNLKVALDGIKLSASDLLSTLSKVETIDLSHKEQLLFLKITDAFADLDAGLLKLQESIVEKKVTSNKQQYLEIKLTDVLITSRLVDDKGLQEDLLGLAGQTEKILIGLLQPPSTDDVILI
jgi:hypothetical protein